MSKKDLADLAEALMGTVESLSMSCEDPEIAGVSADLRATAAKIVRKCDLRLRRIVKDLDRALFALPGQESAASAKEAKVTITRAR